MRGWMVLAVGLSFACSSGKDGGKGGAKLDLSLSVVRQAAGCRAGPRSGPKPLAPGKNVSAVGAGLESLKLHINVIQICESVELNGTAWNNTAGCLKLYESIPHIPALEDH